MSRERQILDAAAALFYEKGFADVGVAEIGARVGLSAAALYRHFSGKEEILATLFGEAMDELIRGTAVVFDDPYRDFERLVGHHVEFAIAHRYLVSVYQREYRSLGPSWRRHFQRRIRQHAARWEVAVAQCQPEISPAHAAAGAQAAIGLICSVAYWPRTILAGSDDLPGVLCRMVEQALAALASPVRA